MEIKVGSFKSQLLCLSSHCTNPESKDIISKMDYLENQSWQNNAITDGLTQDNAMVRYWTESQSFWTTHWNTIQRLLKIERAHRTWNEFSHWTVVQYLFLLKKSICASRDWSKITIITFKRMVLTDVLHIGSGIDWKASVESNNLRYLNFIK